MKNILVTGGTGFIGSHLVSTLLYAGHRVTVADDCSQGRPRNLDGVAPARLRLQQVDLTDERAFDALMTDFDVVFHLAAINGTKNFYRDPARVLDVNTVTMVNAVKLAVRYAVGRFVYFSSSEVYNQAAVVPTPEDVALLVPDIANPRFSYAISKIVGEAYCHHYLKPHEIEFTIIRPHNFYGPRMGVRHVIPEIAVKCLAAPPSGTLEIQGDGSETRAYCFIDDAITGIVAAALSPKAVNETIHIGNDREEITAAALVRMIMEKLGRNDLVIRTGPLREGSATRRCPDVSKAWRLLGYSTAVSLSVGLDRTLAWVAAEWRAGNLEE